MIAIPIYQVLLLPSREVVALHLSLAEASAWVRTYNATMAPTPIRAVIAEETDAPGNSQRLRARQAA